MPSADDDLPPYLWEPVPAPPGNVQRRPDPVRRPRVTVATAGASRRSAPWGVASAAPGEWARMMSPGFARTVPLSRRRLANGIESWWTGGARAGAVTVQRRLQLGRPTGSAETGWTMRGRVRRLTRLHWVPVLVEVWPLYDEFARMTMTPQGHVFASKRYYRLGNSALDRLCAALSELPHPGDT